jgi:hypothetical protein
MRTMITEDALNYINENSTQSKYIYDVLKNVESLLSPTFRKGYLVLENQNDNLNLNIVPKRYLSKDSLQDLGEQIEYLINMESSMQIPFSFNGETFRYQN